MSVDFSNAYQEILLDNLVAIIKQNFIFQTQLKMSEGLEKQKNELMTELNDIKIQFENIKNQASQADVYKMKAEQNNTAHEEKSRIQSALNEELKKSESLQNELKQTKIQSGQLEIQYRTLLEQKDKELSELKERISALEELIPATKLKKLDKVETKKEEVKIEIKEEKKMDPQPIKSKETKAVIDRFIPLTVQGGGTF